MVRDYSVIIKECREWLSQSEMMAARKVMQLQESLDDESFDSLLLASTALPFLSIFYGSRGLVAIEDGRAEDGAIYRSLLYRFWEVRIRVASAAKRSFMNSVGSSGDISILIPNAACLIFAFVALGDKARVRLMLDALRFLLGATDSGRTHLDFHAVNFAVWLGDSYLQGKQDALVGAADGVDKFGIYGGVVQDWGTSRVVESIPTLLNYHYANTDDDGVGRVPGFVWCPFDAIPFEVVAIIGLNSSLGVDFSPVRDQIGHCSIAVDLAAKDVADSSIDRIEDKFSVYFS